MDIVRNFGLYVFLSLEEYFFFFFGETLRRKHDDEASIQLLNNKHASIYYYLKRFLLSGYLLFDVQNILKLTYLEGFNNRVKHVTLSILKLLNFR